jgi:hypothetical protein
VRDVLADLRQTGFNDIHWSDLFASARDKVFEKYRNRLPEYSLRALVFPVVREGDKRELYLRSCPREIGAALSRCVEKRVSVVVVVSDTDFDALAPSRGEGSKPPSQLFLERLVLKIGGDVVLAPLNATWEANEVRVTARSRERTLRVVGRVGSQHDIEVEAADVVLGLFSLARERRARVRNVAEQSLIRG